MFKKARKEVLKHYRQELAAVTLLLVFAIGGVLFHYFGPRASGETYTFSQSSWSGGLDATSTAVHPTNESGWNKYYSASNLIVGGNLTLSTTTATTTQTDDTNSNAGFNLTGSIFSSTTLNGSGSGASIKLLLSGTSFSTTSISGTNTSDYALTMGSDGFPRILVYSGASLYFVQCTNASCSTNNSRNITSLGQTGGSVSMSMGLDGLPRIAYQDVGGVVFVQCTNASCSTLASSTIDTTKGGGNGISIAIGSDGFGRVVYTSSTTSPGVRYAQCTNASCSSIVTTVLDPGGSSSNTYPSLVLGNDGFPRIIYTNSASLKYKFVRCADDACSSVASTTFARYNSVNSAAGIAIGSDGFPRIAAVPTTAPYPTLYVCSNADCTSLSSSTLESVSEGSNAVILRMGLYHDLASVVYYNYPDFKDHLVQCQNVQCSSTSVTNLGSSSGLATALVIGADGNPRTIFYKGSPIYNNFVYPVSSYSSVGSYTSGPINLNFTTPAWGNLSWSQSGTGAITMKARSSATADFSGAADWSTCSNIANGAALSTGGCVTSGHQYIEYQASLSTADTTVSPSLDSVSIGYAAYNSSGNLISSVYDTADATNIMGALSWNEDASMPAGAAVGVSLRTASTTNLLSSATWTDASSTLSGCSKVGSVVTCPNTSLAAAMQTSGSNRYFEYKVTLYSNGGGTATISNVSVQYVVNAPPQITAVSAYQSTSTDANLGKVVINYSALDPDTGSDAYRNQLSPSFEYNVGSGWTAIPAEYLSSGATDRIDVNASSATAYAVTWNAAAQISGTYASSVQIRVTVDDGEPANHSAQATSASFVLDAKPPAVSSAIFNNATKVLSLNASDENNLEYQVSNTYPISSSTAWITVGSSTLSATTTWNSIGGTSAQTVYANFRDAFGNTTSQTIVAPAQPQNFDLRDTSNLATEDWREFISWKLYVATTSAAFSKYEVYRSPGDNEHFSLLTNITNANQNYYTDSSVASSSTYYYRVAVVDTDGDRSDYSVSLSDTVDGQGGTDFTPPSISAVDTPEIQTSWAKIIWTTDEISDSKIEYGTEGYGFTASSTALVTDHSLILSNLSPNTTYRYRVKSKDIFSNETLSNNGGSGYTFTTPGGPVISAVSVTKANDNSATITWNTDRSSDSEIVYATNMSDLLAGSNTQASHDTTMVAEPFQHSITLTNLQPQTRYYFYVASTDANAGYRAIDNNNSSYYYFSTTYDTKAPVISAVSTPILAPQSASVIWQTDELGDSQVEYGTTSGVYPNQDTIDSTLSIYHIASLTGLTPEVKYYYRVKSRDAANNLSTSAEYYFTTPARSTIINMSSAGGAAPPPPKDTAPPTISGIKVEDAGAFYAVISFKTAKPAASFISFGQTTDYGDTSGSPDMSTEHQVRLTRLRPGTDYDFMITALDANGNSAKSGDETFKTKYAAEATDDLINLGDASELQTKIENIIESSLPSLVPPVMSDVEVKNVGATEATINWSTNVRSFGSVAFSPADTFTGSNYISEVTDSSDKSKTHTLNLTNLSPGTKYHFQTRGFVLPGVVGKSTDKTFTTAASEIRADIVKTSNDGFAVAWKTPVDTTSYVEYRNLSTGRVAQDGEEDMKSSHLVEVKNLPSAATYSVRVFGYDKNHTLIQGSPLTLTTRQDKTAPVISGIAISNAFVPYRPNQLQTLISWKTDELANSVVMFEEGVGVSETLANKAGDENDLTTQHTVILSAFKPGTVYRVRISSTDASGNTQTEPTRTIITPTSNDSVFDVILKNFQDSFGFLKNIQ